MNKRLPEIILFIEAVLCLIMPMISKAVSDGFISVITYPFVIISSLLRNLSLSGFAGNVVAWIIYVTICLAPVMIFGWLKKKGKSVRMDYLLIVVSLIMFISMYYMINPTKMNEFAANSFAFYMFLSGMIYSVIVGYLLLRFLYILKCANKRQLQNYMIGFLYVIAIIFIYYAFGLNFQSFMREVGYLSFSGITKTLSYLFLFLRYLCDAVPYILDVLVIFAIISLFTEQMNNSYSKEAIKAVDRVSSLCVYTLYISVVLNIVTNVLQLSVLRFINSFTATIEIPFGAILFTITALLVSQYIKDNTRLKEDNDLFI